MDTLNSIVKNADSAVQKTLANPYVMAVLKITLALYAAQLAPRLPSSVSLLFQNTFVKLLALFLIVYFAEHDFQLAILLAVVFVFGSNLLSGRGLFESFANFDASMKGDGKFTLIEPKSVIYPGCQNITLQDLITAFDGDHIKLQDTVNYSYRQLLSKVTSKDGKENLMKLAYACGLNYNRRFTDEDAPYIATILMYNGFQFGTCMPPQQ